MNLEAVKKLLDSRTLTNSQLLVIWKKAKDGEALILILNRLDVQLQGLTFEQAVDFGLQADADPVWSTIIEKNELTNDQLLEIGNLVGKDGVWRSISEKLNFSGLTAEQLFEQLLSISKIQTNEHFLQMVVDREFNKTIQIDIGNLNLIKLTKAYLGEHARPSTLSYVWYFVSRYLKLDGLKDERILELGQLADYEGLWEYLVKFLRLDGLNDEELLKIGSASKNKSVWDLIFQKLSFAGFTNEQLAAVFHETGQGKSFDSCKIEGTREFYFASKFSLDGLIGDQLFELGKTVKSQCLWERIFATGKLNNEQLYVACSTEPMYFPRLGSRGFGNLFNFDGMTNAELLDFGRLHKGVWPVVAAELKLGDLTKKELEILGITHNNCYVWEVIFKQKKLSNKEMLEYCRSCHNVLGPSEYLYSILAQIILDQKPSFERLMALVEDLGGGFTLWSEIIKGSELTNEQLLKLGRRHSNQNVWGYMILPKLNLENLTDNELFDLGMEFDDDAFWERIVSQPQK